MTEAFPYVNMLHIWQFFMNTLNLFHSKRLPKCGLSLGQELQNYTCLNTFSLTLCHLADKPSQNCMVLEGRVNIILCQWYWHSDAQAIITKWPEKMMTVSDKPAVAYISANHGPVIHMRLLHRSGCCQPITDILIELCSIDHSMETPKTFTPSRKYTFLKKCWRLVSSSNPLQESHIIYCENISLTVHEYNKLTRW